MVLTALMLLTDSSRHSWIAHGFYQQSFCAPVSSHIVGLVGLVGLVTVVDLVTVVGLVAVVVLVVVVGLVDIVTVVGLVISPIHPQNKSSICQLLPYF